MKYIIKTCFKRRRRGENGINIVICQFLNLGPKKTLDKKGFNINFLNFVFLFFKSFSFKGSTKAT